MTANHLTAFQAPLLAQHLVKCFLLSSQIWHRFEQHDERAVGNRTHLTTAEWPELLNSTEELAGKFAGDEDIESVELEKHLTTART